MNLEKCTIDDIKDGNTRIHFIDLMKSEGPVSIGYYALISGFFSGILFYLGNLIANFSSYERYGSGSIVLIGGSFFFGICMGLMSLAMGAFSIHNKIYKIKITDKDYSLAIKSWMIANKFFKQELSENVYILKPDLKIPVFSTIMFTVEEGYAIILAPSLRLKNFVKVFE